MKKCNRWTSGDVRRWKGDKAEMEEVSQRDEMEEDTKCNRWTGGHGRRITRRNSTSDGVLRLV